MFEVIIKHLLIFGAVFLVNVVPAFMPPTWMILSLIAIAYGVPILELVIVGAIASSLGRWVLALYMGPISDRLLPRKQKRNIKYLRNFLSSEGRIVSFIITFLYAIGPLPSNVLFIVAGATRIELASVVSGFFSGRLLSYALLISVAKQIVSFEELFSPINLVLDAVGLALAIAILFMDWGGIMRNILEREKKRRAEEAMRRMFG